ncbi:3-deoxy-manno-octulosonate cytidylyltransferase [Candidatus Poribacteria bacterium]|nr:3-deoxy-manno-octulosonate cytidylyltransferase [Candidatus Poribacteria bacterium]
MKKVIGIIPARYSSSRLPGKPLILIQGKPMIQHVFERSKKASLLKEVYVATDDIRIAECVEKIGGRAIMTSSLHETGTDRIREACENIKADIIVNIQGDEPLIRPEMIDEAVKPLLENDEVYMSTLIKRIDDPEDMFNPSIAKVIMDKKGFAIYFSRSPIPYPRDIREMNIANVKKTNILENNIFYKHVGLYVYSKRFLLKLADLVPTPLEKIEKLEQLRVLENGYKIKLIETRYSTLGVDTPYELNKVKRILKRGEAPWMKKKKRM